MQSITNHIRERMYSRRGIDPLPSEVNPNRLRFTEWSPEFEKLQRDRLFMGALRYGRLGADGKPRYDRCTSIKQRIGRYVETGNLEHLVDAANLCMCEFVESHHPNKHFAAADDIDHVDRKEALT